MPSNIRLLNARKIIPGLRIQINVPTYLSKLEKNIKEMSSQDVLMVVYTDYGHPVRKSPSLHGRKSTPTPKFLGMAEAYFVGHIGLNFQISLIYAFIECP
jgi:hypothetical protein